MTRLPLWFAVVLLAMLLIALGGCAALPPPAAGGPPAAGAAPPPAARAAPSSPSSSAAPRVAEPPPRPTVAPELAAEQRWLEALFDGTPVQVAAWAPPPPVAAVGPKAPARPPAPGTALLRVEVPLRYAFDEGRDEPARPLAAVLDRVAQSLARQPRARAQVAAPSAQRAAAVQRHLGTKGIAPWRVERLPARSDAVELRLRVVDAAVQRVD